MTPEEDDGEDDPYSMDWAVNIEIALVEAFHWSLRDIDLTDVESLTPFILKLAERARGETPRGMSGGQRKAFADEVGWL